MSYKLPSELKPFMLGVEYSYLDGICPEVSDAPIFAAFIKGNPGAAETLSFATDPWNEQNTRPT